MAWSWRACWLVVSILLCTFSCAHAVRPQKPIPYDTLRDYVLAGLTLPKMVAALALIGIKVCPKTVSRRLEQRLGAEHLGHRPGYAYIDSFLRSKISPSRPVGIIIPERRIRKALRLYDYEAHETRKTTSRIRLRLRTYYAPYFGYSWHCDMDLKLQGVNFYMTGVVDGSTRYCVWLDMVTWKSPMVKLFYFLEAVRKHGVPDQVTIDKGSENTLITFVLDELRTRGVTQATLESPARKTVNITDSRHNVPIERFWGEPNTHVVAPVTSFMAWLKTSLPELHTSIIEPSHDGGVWRGSFERVFLPALKTGCDDMVKMRNNKRIRRARGGGFKGGPEQLIKTHAHPNPVMVENEQFLSVDYWVGEWRRLHPATSLASAPQNEHGVDCLKPYVLQASARDAYVTTRFTSVQVMVWLRNNNFVEVAQALDIEQRTTVCLYDAVIYNRALAERLQQNLRLRLVAALANVGRQMGPEI